MLEDSSSPTTSTYSQTLPPLPHSTAVLMPCTLPTYIHAVKLGFGEEKRFRAEVANELLEVQHNSVLHARGDAHLRGILFGGEGGGGV